MTARVSFTTHFKGGETTKGCFTLIPVNAGGQGGESLHPLTQCDTPYHSFSVTTNNAKKFGCFVRTNDIQNIQKTLDTRQNIAYYIFV